MRDTAVRMRRIYTAILVIPNMVLYLIGHCDATSRNYREVGTGGMLR